MTIKDNNLISCSTLYTRSLENKVMAVQTLDDLLAEGVAGRTVLVRSDLNVPLKDGVITDPGLSLIHI